MRPPHCQPRLSHALVTFLYAANAFLHPRVAFSFCHPAAQRTNLQSPPPHLPPLQKIRLRLDGGCRRSGLPAPPPASPRPRSAQRRLRPDLRPGARQVRRLRHPDRPAPLPPRRHRRPRLRSLEGPRRRRQRQRPRRHQRPSATSISSTSSSSSAPATPTISARTPPPPGRGAAASSPRARSATPSPLPAFIPSTACLRPQASALTYAVTAGVNLNVYHRFELRLLEAGLVQTHLPNGSTNLPERPPLLLRPQRPHRPLES